MRTFSTLLVFLAALSASATAATTPFKYKLDVVAAAINTDPRIQDGSLPVKDFVQKAAVAFKKVHPSWNVVVTTFGAPNFSAGRSYSYDGPRVRIFKLV